MKDAEVPEDLPGAIERLLEAAAAGSEETAARVREACRRFDRLRADRAAREAQGGGIPARFGIIGASAPMRAVFERIPRFAASDFPVLIQGESGTGKELVARALHAQSRRATGPFLWENCAAVPETLLESILFGHVRGAFTDAHRDRPGHFVSAHGGTLFLDEVGDMPLAMQTKLLRVLEDGMVRPVGGTAARKVDVRVLGATNQDLEAKVAEGTFREDLYYRLNVLSLRLPPLRERGEDIWILARHFLAGAAAEVGRELAPAEGLRERLLAFPWPGNVRQLENAIRRAAALCEGPLVAAADLGLEEPRG